jgi:hypothetical protein
MSISSNVGEARNTHNWDTDLQFIVGQDETGRWIVVESHGRGGELCWIFGDGVNQAADFFSDATSIPSRNVTPLTTFGN